MVDLIREFPCFSAVVIAGLLVLLLLTIAAVETVLLARIKAKALVDIARVQAVASKKQGEEDA